MRLILRSLIPAAAAGLLGVSTAAAQIVVVLPDSSQTTTVSAVVNEQARVSVPAGIAFSVTNVGAATDALPAAVSVDQIVVASATRQLRISLRADAASFTPPVGGATTWAAGDVSWNAASWTAATGAAGSLSAATFSTVATCDPGATACATSALTFSLAAKPAVQRSGTHTLIVTWKVESIGS